MSQIIDCPPSTRPTHVDLEAIKARQRATWASGDFSVIGTTLGLVGETLCEAADVGAGARVLDVACGNGNAALAATRRFAHVTGLDYVRPLLDRAAERAHAERSPLELVEGDAESLPFADGAFDVVLSTFGVMFAPDQERAAAELLRVVRPGGIVALANWTPDGFVGRMLGLVGRRLPPPVGLASPVYWGVRARLFELFRGARAVRTTPRDFVFRYESAEHFVDVFRTYYGPTHKAFGALSPGDAAALTKDLFSLIGEHQRPAAHGIAIPAEYLEVLVER